MERFEGAQLRHDYVVIGADAFDVMERIVRRHFRKVHYVPGSREFYNAPDGWGRMSEGHMRFGVDGGCPVIEVYERGMYMTVWRAEPLEPLQCRGRVTGFRIRRRGSGCGPEFTSFEPVPENVRTSGGVQRMFGFKREVWVVRGE